MLVVRELLLGRKRYTDLLDGLPGVGTNVLAVRLRHLEAAGIIAREKLPPPAASTVYELTDDGVALRPVVDELARWGARRMDRPERGEALRTDWLVYSLAVCTPPTGMRTADELERRVDDEPHTLTVRHGRFEARPGAAAHRPPSSKHRSARCSASLAVVRLVASSSATGGSSSGRTVGRRA